MSAYGLKAPNDSALQNRDNPSSIAATTNKESSFVNVLQTNDSSTTDQITPKR